MPNQEPVILCHAACTGGSMIYRIVVSSFDLVGISEVSHRFPFNEGALIPTDPERALLADSVIDEAEYERIFFDRILYSNEVCQKKEKLLMIREHTHSYFFSDSSNTPTLSLPSWIAQQYLERLDKQTKCIITARDPIDSWLGLCASFPELALKGFQNYCTAYSVFIKSALKNQCEQNVLLIKYEDLIENQLEQLQRISKFIDVPFSGKISNDWSCISSTGNSGRQGDKIRKRKRRPFGLKLIRDAESSESYRYLVENLGYSHLSDSISIRVRVSAFYIDLRTKFASVLTRVLRRILCWALSKSRVP